MNIAAYYHKAILAAMDAHLGRKTRRLMTLKLEVETIEQKVYALNYERQLENELADFQRLVTDHKRDLRLAGHVKHREAA